MKIDEAPSEFLAQIKVAHALPFKGREPSTTFLKLHDDQQRQLGAREINPEEFLDRHFTEMLELLASVLPDAIQNTVLNSIAVGCLDNQRVNAFIIRNESPQCFAILVSRALITMINHYTKLVAAANHPSSVLYCNGLPTETLTRSDFIRLSVQMLTQYGATGEPHGPELKIALHTPAMEYVENALWAMHLFVLAHELGHFLNGDLDEQLNFTKCNWMADATMFAPNPSHEMEFKADETAFELVLRVLASKQPKLPARVALDMHVTVFFNFAREISNRGCESHPRPSARLLRITDKFFGSEAANLMGESFSDLSKIAEFRNSVGSISVAELLSSRNIA